MLNFSRSFSDFLYNSESRIAKFIVRAMRYDAHGYESSKLMITNKEVNYLTLRQDGTISYLPKGKEHVVNDDGHWARGNRQNGRAGTIIKKVLTPNARKLFKDAEFEAFVNAYKVACDEESKTFIIRENKYIPEVYCMDREGGGGTLNDSCMNGDGEYLELYKYCPHVRILTMINSEGLLSGRALLWTTNDGTVMDRIYVTKDHYYEMFLDYADENDWYRKVEYKSYKDKYMFIRKGVRHDMFWKIETKTEFDYYPYIDTFQYGGDGWISNDDSRDHEYVYCETGGGREGDNREWCAYNEEYIDSDDATYIERGTYSGNYINKRYTVLCETDDLYYYEDYDGIVEINNTWYRTDDENVVELNDTYYHTSDDDIRWSKFHDEYLLDDDCVHSEHHDSYIKSDEAYEVAGEYFHESVVNKVA